ncbi:GTP-binding protein EngB [Seminavis robusta]|uniref:GTP-binding protein EngB n=1 Tax=Seminavis robusta TaxID=568900 RepID=A0A9N8ETE6_9STRA|nr:GTP-binding protein EngB [Seminavis robusta]|eukprot:Sro1912_g305000.1 GTP-binding protein EngB (379) ;mRNA; r:15671-16807
MSKSLLRSASGRLMLTSHSTWIQLYPTSCPQHICFFSSKASRRKQGSTRSSSKKKKKPQGQDTTKQIHHPTPKKQRKAPKVRSGKIFVPPALLLPTASPFAYVARAAVLPTSTGIAEGEDNNDDDENPLELARTLFADDHQDPLADMTFEYCSPQSFGHELPRGNIPEVAFLGRSNVGKSSLINAVMKRDLARCSKHPGRTQQPYYYALQPSSQQTTAVVGFLVDLPGYGYANAPDKHVDEWQQQTQDFLQSRRDAGALQRLFLLVDARRGMHTSTSNIDLAVMRWMDEQSIPYSVVITKADCVNKPQQIKVANEACIRYQQQHQDEREQVLVDGVPEEDVVPSGYMGPIVYITSAKKKEGMIELRAAIESELFWAEE